MADGREPVERWTLELLGVPLTVEAGPSRLSLLKSVLAGVAYDTVRRGGDVWRLDEQDSGQQIRRGDLALGDFDSPELAIVALAGHLELHAASACPEFVAVHAGVVAVADQCVVLPGRSRAGKSTLTRALLQAGASYFSDEYALLDPTGTVHAFPRPLRLRRTGMASLVVPAKSLQSRVPTGPHAVALVAELRFDAQGGWGVRELSPAETTLALIDNAVPAQIRSADTLTACSAAARGAVGIAGTRGEADDAAVRLLAMLRSG